LLVFYENYIIPGIPPISGIAGADDLSSGLSIIIASVVVNKVGELIKSGFNEKKLIIQTVVE
jgi:hypothetical protein